MKHWLSHKKITASFFQASGVENGIKLSVGPIYKYKEKENRYMVIGSGPQITFFKDQIYLGVELDFQTKFNSKKQFSPVVGVYSDILFCNLKIPSKFSSAEDQKK